MDIVVKLHLTVKNKYIYFVSFTSYAVELIPEFFNDFDAIFDFMELQSLTELDNQTH